MAFIFIEGTVTLESYKQLAATCEGPVVFIFPGNATHHTPGTTLYSVKSGLGLAEIAGELGSTGYPVLSLPTTGMECWSKSDQIKQVIENAIADIYKAIGAGYNIMLPVRNFVTGGFFPSSLDIPNFPGFEPSFWGLYNTTVNEGLAKHYIIELNALIKFAALNHEERLASLEEGPFRQAYLIGLTMHKDDPWLMSPPQSSPTFSRLTQRHALSRSHEVEADSLASTMPADRPLSASIIFGFFTTLGTGSMVALVVLVALSMMNPLVLGCVGGIGAAALIVGGLGLFFTRQQSPIEHENQHLKP